MYKTKHRILLIYWLILFSYSATYAQSEKLEHLHGNADWKKVEPAETSPLYAEPVQFFVTDTFLSSPGIMRRDPSDVIYHAGRYYVWYTKIPEGNPGYPGGWTGTVWCASSTDGQNWQEEGEAVGAGTENDWDGAGAYTPNILMFEDKFYLAYTAMSYPFSRKYGQASIGLAVANSPKGPWEKLNNNPVISPGKCLQSPDGFLTDDAVFVVENNKIRLYYKGYPRWQNENGETVRAGGNTYLMMAGAETPAGPYTKHPLPLHRGHEVVVWKDELGIGSFGIGWGKFLYYFAPNGLNFNSLHPLELKEENFRIKAAGVYRQDFENNRQLTKPEWGICMAPGQGLARFEIKWPENE